MSNDELEPTAADYRRAYALLGAFARGDELSGVTYQAIVAEALDSKSPAHAVARLLYAVTTAAVLAYPDREFLAQGCASAVLTYSSLENETTPGGQK